jgi:ribose transport system permease protein
MAKRLFTDYGMILVLIFLIALFSVLTVNQEELSGSAAAEMMAESINSEGGGKNVLIISSTSADEIEMTQRLAELLQQGGHTVLARVNGDPPQAGAKLRELEERGETVDVLAVTGNVSGWSLITNASSRFAICAGSEIIQPDSRRFPQFLKRDNLRNIADRISVIAILAIGMTMVIITAGIDLSVGSLIALAAVTSALFIREYGGDADAGPVALIGCSILAILICGVMGFFSGTLSTTYMITPFIATLAMMMIARGLAYKFSNVTTIPVTNESFAWLGKGRVGGIPVSVIVMTLLYAAAYFVMHRTTLGRYIYAIGGNTEAARLSGVPVKKVLVLVYTICGLLAGLGGVITASNLAGGAATYGDYYELYTIAAVVVGGTSLMGGEGKIMGTLIGAFIIAVIQSGMNQIGIESNTQKVVFGLVIIGAIVTDKYKRREIRSRNMLYLMSATAIAGVVIYLVLKMIYPENFN